MKERGGGHRRKSLLDALRWHHSRFMIVANGKGQGMSLVPVKIKIGICPICGKEASSEHHIRPVADGGSDDKRNKVLVCFSCHDLLEQIYEETGMMFCPALVEVLQIKYGYPSTRAKRPYRYRSLKAKAKTKLPRFLDAYTVCNRCGEGFYREDTNIIFCPTCCEILLERLRQIKAR